MYSTVLYRTAYGTVRYCMVAYRSVRYGTVDGVKNQDATAACQSSARDDAIEATRRLATAKWETERQKIEACQTADSQRLQTELHLLFLQSVHNHTLAGVPPPTIDSFIQTMHLQAQTHQSNTLTCIQPPNLDSFVQIITPHVAHHNRMQPDPADQMSDGPPAKHSQSSPLEGVHYHKVPE